MAKILGIDVGGSGVKGAIVDTNNGNLVSEKLKYATPQPSTPKNVGVVLNQLISDFDWKGHKVGCGFPSIIKDNICHSAANIDNQWIGLDLSKYFHDTTGCNGRFVNDADAAGIAEMIYGAGKGRKGTVLMLTLGTGIGSGLFRNGHLVPNTEFGHLLYKESIFEHYASNSARKNQDLSWEEWGLALNTYLRHIEFILNPDIIILGGGVSKRYEFYSEYIDISCEIVPAQMENNAGIIGAAVLAHKKDI